MKPYEPDSEPEAEDDCDARAQQNAKMIDEVKNVTAPKEVYLWESSPAPSPAASLTRAAPPETVGCWAAALLSAAEDWLRGQAASIFAEDAPMDVEETHAAMDMGEASSEPHADLPNVTAGHGLVNRWNQAVLRAQAASSSDAVDDGSPGAAGHRFLAVPARSDVPAARGSVSEEPRPPTHTPEEEMAERLRAFEKATDKKLRKEDVQFVRKGSGRMAFQIRGPPRKAEGVRYA